MPDNPAPVNLSRLLLLRFNDEHASASENSAPPCALDACFTDAVLDDLTTFVTFCKVRRQSDDDVRCAASMLLRCIVVPITMFCAQRCGCLHASP